MSCEVSPDVVRDLHRDAIRLARTEIVWSAMGLALAAAACVLTLYLADLFRAVVAPAAAMVGWFGHSVREWSRLRRADPLEAYLATDHGRRES